MDRSNYMLREIYRPQILLTIENLSLLNESGALPHKAFIAKSLNRLQKLIPKDEYDFDFYVHRLIKICIDLEAYSLCNQLIYFASDHNFRLKISKEIFGLIKQLLRRTEFDLALELIELLDTNPEFQELIIIAKSRSLIGLGKFNDAHELLWRSFGDRIRCFSNSATNFPTIIPKSIYQFWDSKEIPLVISRRMDSWRVLNPGWSHHVFNSESAKQIMSDVGGFQALRAFESLQVPAAQADLFRYAVLIKFGGVYVDADDKPSLPLDISLGNIKGIVFIEKRLWHIQNSFIVSPPSSLLLQNIFDKAIWNVNQRLNKSISAITGPALVSRILRSKLENEFKSDTVYLIPKELGMGFRYLSGWGDRELNRHWSTISRSDYYH